jgi:pteridine reductase
VSDPRPVALVTGGAKRVGLAIVTELARAGCDIVLTYHTSEAEAHQTTASVRALGVDARAVRLPLTNLPELERRLPELLALSPRWDVLVHNASAYAALPVSELSAERVMTDYAVNAAAPLLLSAAFAPALSASTLPHGGAIVAMLDIHAMGRPRRDHASYSMSKAALGEMVRSLARDLAPRVRVNGVAPGVVAWPSAGRESEEEFQKAYLNRVPLARAGTPEDAARAVRFLALEAGYVTGTVLAVDGGRSLA